METRIRAALVAAFIFPAGLSCPPSVAQEQSKGFSNWDVQFLYGTHFHEPGNPNDVSKAIVTFENSSAWSWGSSYFFVDTLKSNSEDNRATEVYSEWYPSASLSKLSGKNLALGPVRDVSATFGLNAGTKSTGAAPLVYLPGFTFDLKLPGFAFFTLGTYAYIDQGLISGVSNGCHSTTFQVTPSWALPFRIGRVKFSFDGFLDYIGSHGQCGTQIISQPQLKIDLASLGAPADKFYLGIEWQYWRNKFGIEGVDESFPQALFVWKF